MRRVINNRPIVFCAVSMALGMIVTALNGGVSVLFYLFSVICLIFCLICFFVKPLKKYKIEAIVISLFFVVGALYTLYNIFLYNADQSFVGKSVFVNGIVSDISTASSGNYRITLSDLKIGGYNTYGGAYFYTDNSEYVYGEEIKLNGDISFLPFSIVSYSAKTNFKITSQTILSVTEPTNPLYIVSNYVKNLILTNVSGDEGGIIVALLLGDTSKIAEDTLSNFRLSGISHIFAVSGLHVVFFSSVVGTVLSLFRIKGVTNTIIGAVFCLFYAGLCGFPVSCMRAVIMSITLNTVKNLGRKYDVLNSLLLSFIIVLAIFPHTLFSYGFILSYLAVFSIAVCNKSFEPFFTFLPESIAQSLSVSFAVSFIMTPVLFKMFGYSSLIVIFLNVLLVPMVSVLYTLSFVATVLTAILPFMSFVFKLPYFVAYFLNSFLVEINSSVFTLSSDVSVVAICLYYIFAFIFCERTNFKKPVKFISCLLSLSTLVLSLFGVL